MGFLLGAFGKLQAGRRVRDLQARLMRVSTKTRRAQRQIDRLTKSLEAQKKAETNGVTLMQQMLKMSMQTTLQGKYGNSVFGALDASASAESQQAYAQYQNDLAQANARAEFMITQMKQQIEEKYESMNDMMLEPLKMEEESLQTEKDTLESQIQIAQQDYEACKKMEQADAKNLAPNYTGQS
jgi:hypothetical protein